MCTPGDTEPPWGHLTSFSPQQSMALVAPVPQGPTLEPRSRSNLEFGTWQPPLLPPSAWHPSPSCLTCPPCCKDALRLGGARGCQHPPGVECEPRRGCPHPRDPLWGDTATSSSGDKLCSGGGAVGWAWRRWGRGMETRWDGGTEPITELCPFFFPATAPQQFLPQPQPWPGSPSMSLRVPGGQNVPPGPRATSAA